MRSRRKSSLSDQILLLGRQWNRFQRSLQASVRHIRFWFFCLIAASLLAGVLYFLFAPTFTVQAIRVSRQDARADVEEIQQILSPFFDKHMLFLSPALVERAIQSAYPEIAKVEVQKEYPSQMEVVIYMDDIVAEVFIGDPNHTEADFQYPEERSQYNYVTAGGYYLEYLFAIPPKERDGERLQLHLVDWAAKPVHRQQLFKPESIEHMRRTQTVLEDSFGHAVGGITFYHRANEYHVRTESLVLWFDFASSTMEQLERYRQFLRMLSLEDVESYIDLRLHDRVVYW